MHLSFHYSNKISITAFCINFNYANKIFLRVFDVYEFLDSTVLFISVKKFLKTKNNSLGKNCL